MNLRQVGSHVHFVEDMVQRKVVKFVDCMTDNNVSEITTKPLGGAKFKKFTLDFTQEVVVTVRILG